MSERRTITETDIIAARQRVASIGGEATIQRHHLTTRFTVHIAENADGSVTLRAEEESTNAPE